MLAVEQANLDEIHRLDDDIVKKIIKNINTVLNDDDINFSGDLSKSIKPEIIDEIRYVLVDSPYATIVDKGMPPGKNVNFDKLRNWVEGKLGVPSEESNTVTMKIMNKIKAKGIKPKFFAKKALKILIGKHGVPIIKKNRRQRPGRLEKFLTKASRIMKKVSKASKRIVKNINKVDRALNKYG